MYFRKLVVNWVPFTDQSKNPVANIDKAAEQCTSAMGSRVVVIYQQTVMQLNDFKKMK